MSASLYCEPYNTILKDKSCPCSPTHVARLERQSDLVHECRESGFRAQKIEARVYSDPG